MIAANSPISDNTNSQENCMRMTHRLFAMTVLASVALSARAEYPEKAIRFIVPYATGGTTDLVARVVGEKVAARLGKPVVI
jgi:tripartite-type tricarboxylate transporter receptor subunit TctC